MATVFRLLVHLPGFTCMLGDHVAFVVALLCGLELTWVVQYMVTVECIDGPRIFLATEWPVYERHRLLSADVPGMCPDCPCVDHKQRMTDNIEDESNNVSREHDTLSHNSSY